MKNIIKNQKGATITIFALAAVVLLGFTALVTDIGLLVVHKARLTNAVDAAALAGAQDVIDSPGAAKAAASNYLEKNGYLNDSFEFELVKCREAIRVSASHEVKFGLARVLGFSSKTVHATAVGRAFPITKVNKGVRPFAIENKDFEFGVRYTLKKGGGNGNTGNYGCVSLGGTGANVYENNIINGYTGSLKVGDIIQTEPGNMSGPTKNGVSQLISKCPHTPQCVYYDYEPDCPRIITVIIVDNLDVHGRDNVKIVGFASFFLEGVQGSGNECEVTGRFIKTVTSGEMSESQHDYGLYGVRLEE